MNFTLQRSPSWEIAKGPPSIVDIRFQSRKNESFRFANCEPKIENSKAEILRQEQQTYVAEEKRKRRRAHRFVHLGDMNSGPSEHPLSHWP